MRWPRGISGGHTHVMEAGRRTSADPVDRAVDRESGIRRSSPTFHGSWSARKVPSELTGIGSSGPHDRANNQGSPARIAGVRRVEDATSYERRPGYVDLGLSRVRVRSWTGACAANRCRM